jgi:hypothetical protein
MCARARRVAEFESVIGDVGINSLLQVCGFLLTISLRSSVLRPHVRVSPNVRRYQLSIA